MSIIYWVLFGLVVGIIANLLDPRPSTGGMIGAIVLGIVGALVGGFLGNLIFGIGISGFNIYSFAISVLGALLVLFISRAFASTDEI